MSARSATSTDAKALGGLARYFYALKDALRLQIVVLLARRDECTVNQMAAALNISQPLVSWHLRRLKAGGLVKMRRAGRAVYCSLDRESIEAHQQKFLSLLGES